ncbi:MAG: hypothetical protein KC621_33970 [Myxococcales bacterium]|nr:hypothetical protein [Myxococcales bacterium]
MAGLLAARLSTGATPEERALAAHALGNSRSQVEHLGVLLRALLTDVPVVQAAAAQTLAIALEDDTVDRRDRVSNAMRGIAKALGQPPELDFLTRKLFFPRTRALMRQSIREIRARRERRG